MDLPEDASAADVGVVQDGLRDDELPWFRSRRRELEEHTAASDPNAPTDAAALVSQHAVCVVPERWSKFADWLQPFEDSGWARLSRGDVSTVAARCRITGEWLPLLVASFMWGQGIRGYGPTRLSWILDGQPSRPAPALDQIRDRLAACVRVLDDNGPGDAYALLQRRSGRIPHFGPAFLTKYLYFAYFGANTRDDCRDCRPLVLDKVLAGRMRWFWARRRDEPYGVDIARAEWLWKGPCWTTRRYRVYLAFMHRAATQLSAAGSLWTPDLVELILFSKNPADMLGHAPEAGPARTALISITSN
jgi:hypothetical protein